MAFKGQKFKSYPPVLKREILNKYFKEARSSYSLAIEYNISPNTIQSWIRKVKKNIDVTLDHRLGRSGKFTKRKNLTLEDYRERYEILKKYLAFLQARRKKK